MEKPGCERFIQRQLDGLADLGLSPEALKREEALLRAGLERNHLLFALFQRRQAASSSEAVGHKKKPSSSEATGVKERPA